MGTEEEVKEIFDEAMAKAKDPKEILKAIMIEGRQVPKDYWELASNVQFFVNNVPGHYLTWGNRRYERGSLEYTHESRFGPINDCYLPETDAIKDIEEELIDAMFNTMVLYWKGQSSPASGELVRAITAALDACEEMRKLAAQ